MNIPPILSLSALLWSSAAVAHGPVSDAPAEGPPPIVTQVMTKALPEYPGKEALILNVEFPPGGVDPVHRHDAHGFVYVLEGSIVMGVAGGKEVTLSPGEAFHEGPQDIHTVGRNASKDKPARFLVLLLKDIGKPAVIVPP